MPPKRMPQRIVVHSKDVENITGLMPRSARRLLQSIRERAGKPKGAFVTVREFCSFTGIDEELLKDYLCF